MRQWLLIYDNPMNGAHNMAVDHAIMSGVARGETLPTLRLYAWVPPCLSLGYGQRAGDADLERIQALGWDMVRRPTGGRAILHTDELTYSVALPAGDPLAAGDIVESYRRISRALVSAVEQLGALPQADKQAGHEAMGAVCFEVPSHYEITVGGRKLVGSAQVRRSGGVLQHGSLPLVGDLARICDALAYADEEAREEAKRHVHKRAITLEEALGGQVVSWQAAAQAVAEAFARVFEIEFQEANRTDALYAEARELEAEFYGNAEWTQRR